MTEPKARVLFLSGWYPNRTAPSHGIFVQRQAEAVAKRCPVAALHICSDAALKEKHELVEQEINNVYTVISYYKKVDSNVPLVASITKLKRYLSAGWQGYRHIEKNFGKPNLLHLNIAFPAGIFALQLVKELKVPLVLSEHWSGYLPEDGNYSGRMMKRITKKVVAKACRVFHISEKMKTSMLAHGLKNDYAWVPNAVDTSLFHPSGKPREGMIKLVHVSTVNDREKNISGLLRAFANTKTPNLQLEIIGDGPELANFQSLANKLKLNAPQLRFAGFLQPSEVAERMRNSDFLVLFSNYEGLPCVILEALASGIPVLATDVGGIPQVVSNAQGVLVPPGDEAALANAIGEMASNCRTYNKAELADYAKKKFSYEAVGTTLFEHYNSILAD